MTAEKKDKAGSRDRAAAGRRNVRTTDSHVANALRNAYEEAVSEDVPSEFLDLLGKLT